ncbi:hypothetical protein BDZ97DRAFT_1156494 [Flammula alnicola]|nr:hypothetical protein BDZ97DRAFT_1156494 [Flammula alnicola]
MKFACYLPAEDPLFVVVEIGSDAWVAELLMAIYEELNSESRRYRDDLRIFKTDVPIKPTEDLHSRALQWLRRQPANSHLEDTTKLASFFPNGSHPSGDRLDIIVADAEVLELVEDLDDPEGPYKRKVKKDI